MNSPDALVTQLLDTVRQRMESKVLKRLESAGGAAQGVAALIDEVFAEEQSELETRAATAQSNGEDVQAEMYRLMRSDLLPQAVESLRARLRQG